MKLSRTTLVLITAAGLAVSTASYAQKSHEEHHPGAQPGKMAQGKEMPMEKGMKPSEMPQRGMKGKGMMMDGKMGPGMMGKGMMKGGMMGRMRQGGMMGR
ncbi:MAG: hypothetical protein K0U74_14660, partial [Alphaproteobacteria bacterium]|nr:hypothetical protein [Alphaproteobacteria bacterium]